MNISDLTDEQIEDAWEIAEPEQRELLLNSVLSQPAPQAQAAEAEEQGFFSRMLGGGKKAGGTLLDFGEKAANALFAPKEWDAEKYQLEQYRNMMMGLPYDQTALAAITAIPEADKDRGLQTEQMAYTQAMKAWDTLKQEQGNLDTRRAGARQVLGSLWQSYVNEQNPAAKATILRNIKTLQAELDTIGNDMGRVGELMDKHEAPEWYLRRGERATMSGDNGTVGNNKNIDSEIYGEIDPLLGGVTINPSAFYDEAFAREFLRAQGREDLMPYADGIASILEGRRQALVGREFEKLEMQGKKAGVKASELSYQSAQNALEKSNAELNDFKNDRELLAQKIHGKFPFNPENVATLARLDDKFKADLNEMNINVSGVNGLVDLFTGQKKKNAEARFNAALESLRKRIPAPTNTETHTDIRTNNLGQRVGKNVKTGKFEVLP